MNNHQKPHLFHTPLTPLMTTFGPDRSHLSYATPQGIQASPVAQQVKNLPLMQKMWETQVRSLGQEDPLEEEMATHFSILAWEIPWTEEPGGLQSKGSQRVGHG